MSIPGYCCKSLLTFLHLLEFVGNLPSWGYMHLPSARILHPMLFSLKAHHHTHHTSGWSFIFIRWPPKRAEFHLTILVNECRHMFLEATPVPSFSLSRPPSCWAVFLCMAHRQDEALCTASTCIGNLKSDNLQIGKVMGKKHMSHLIMWRHVGSRVNRRLMEQ